MKRFFISAVMTLLVLNVFLFMTQTCSAAPRGWGYYYQPGQNVQAQQGQNVQAKQDSNVQAKQGNANYNPYYRHPWRPMTPTEMQTGYTLEQIHAMPILERPDRPGHFIGNALRWQYRQYKNYYKK